MKITPESLQAEIIPEELVAQNEPKKSKKEKKPKKERHLFGKSKSIANDNTIDNDVIVDDEHDDDKGGFVDDEHDDDKGGFVDDEQDSNEVVEKPKSRTKTAIIVSCVVVLLTLAGVGTYLYVSSLSIDNTQTPANKTLSKEEQTLLNSDNFDKDNEKRTGDTDIKVDTPKDSSSDAERIVKLQAEIDRLKSELEKAQSATPTPKDTATQTPVKEIPIATPAVSESDTVKNLKKQLSELQGLLSASQERELYLQNQLNAAKNDNSK